MRKPRPFKCCGVALVATCREDIIGGWTGRRVIFQNSVCANGAESLAAWLLKAAEWIREKEVK